MRRTAPFLALAILLALATAATAQPTLEVGAPFPDLVLPDLDGAPRSIAEYRGRKVVLHVFASW